MALAGALAGLLGAHAAMASAALLPSERAALAHPAPSVAAQVAQIAPIAIALIRQTEADVIAKGRPLRGDEIALARAVGVADPARVRVLEESAVPGYGEPPLARLIRGIGAGNPRMWGLTALHGIVFKTQPTRFLLAHELRHVAQYERLGLDRFARRYVTELLVVGYTRSPLEAEADQVAHRQDAAMTP